MEMHPYVLNNVQVNTLCECISQAFCKMVLVQ